MDRRTFGKLGLSAAILPLTGFNIRIPRQLTAEIVEEICDKYFPAKNKEGEDFSALWDRFLSWQLKNKGIETDVQLELIIKKWVGEALALEERIVKGYKNKRATVEFIGIDSERMVVNIIDGSFGTEISRFENGVFFSYLGLLHECLAKESK